MKAFPVALRMDGENDLTKPGRSIDGQVIYDRWTSKPLAWSMTTHYGIRLIASLRRRDYVIEHTHRLASREGNWKYIEPAPGEPFKPLTGTETANSPQPQLYDLSDDAAEKKNVAVAHADRVKAMAEKLAVLQKTSRTRP